METGTGKVKDQYCGTFKLMPGSIAGACQNHPDEHKPAAIPLGCTRRECPECWPKWARRSGKRISALVNGYLNQKYKDQVQLLPGDPGAYLPDHVMISPGRATVQKLVAETEREISDPGVLVSASNQFHKIFMKKYRKEEARILALLEIAGGISIPHNIRLRSSKESEKADRANDTNRYREVLDRPDWHDGVKFSPHSHIITDGSYIPMTSDQLYEQTGWIYRNIGEISNLEALVFYLMSHAPVIEDLHNDRPFGTLHPSRLAHVGTTKIPVYPKCPECLAAGIAPEFSEYRVGIIGRVEYDRNDRGRKVLKTWTFEAVTNKPYRRTESIKEYRILLPGERIDRHKEPKWSRYFNLEKWEALPPESKPRQWV
jgi:hypothetical protein